MFYKKRVFKSAYKEFAYFFSLRRKRPNLKFIFALKQMPKKSLIHFLWSRMTNQLVSISISCIHANK
jgi:hypothetical protein